MDSCLFCKILKKEIPSNKIYEDDNVFGFVDIYPQAKTHLLFIHKLHTDNINEMADDPKSIGEIFSAIQKYTRRESIDQEGFRIVTNLGPLAGQTVFHTHFHVLSGEKLGRFGS